MQKNMEEHVALGLGEGIHTASVINIKVVKTAFKGADTLGSLDFTT